MSHPGSLIFRMMSCEWAVRLWNASVQRWWATLSLARCGSKLDGWSFREAWKLLQSFILPWSRDPELHMDVCTYLAPLDEKEVQRNWVFSGVGNQGEAAPHIWKLFRSVLALPSRLQILQPHVWKELLGGVHCETSCWKGTPERFTLESLSPSQQPHPTPTSWRICSPVQGLEVQAV